MAFCGTRINQRQGRFRRPGITVTRATTPKLARVLERVSGSQWPSAAPRPFKHPAPCGTTKQAARVHLFEDVDYALYLDLLADGAERAGVAI